MPLKKAASKSHVQKHLESPPLFVVVFFLHFRLPLLLNHPNPCTCMLGQWPQWQLKKLFKSRFQGLTGHNINPELSHLQRTPSMQFRAFPWRRNRPPLSPINAIRPFWFSEGNHWFAIISSTQAWLGWKVALVFRSHAHTLVQACAVCISIHSLSTLASSQASMCNFQLFRSPQPLWASTSITVDVKPKYLFPPLSINNAGRISVGISTRRFQGFHRKKCAYRFRNYKFAPGWFFYFRPNTISGISLQYFTLRFTWLWVKGFNILFCCLLKQFVSAVCNVFMGLPISPHR